MILYCDDGSAGPMKRNIAGQLEIREQEWGTYVLDPHSGSVARPEQSQMD